MPRVTKPKVKCTAKKEAPRALPPKQEGPRALPPPPPPPPPAPPAPPAAPPVPPALQAPRSPDPALDEPTDEEDDGSNACPRLGVSQQDYGWLQEGESWGDIPHRTRCRIQRHFHRAKDSGKLPQEAVDQFMAIKHRKGAAQLEFFRNWSNGILPGWTGQATEHIQVSSVLEDEDNRIWLNFNELLHHWGGHVSQGQKKYCMKLWRAVAGGPERSHPDGSSLPAQRRFHLSSIIRLRKIMKEETGVSVSGGVDSSQGMAQVEAPRGGFKRPANDPGSAPQDAPDAKKQKEPDVEELPRSKIMEEMYKLIPRIMAAEDRLPGTMAGQMAQKELLQPLLARIFKAKAELEKPGAPAPNHLAEANAAV